ncbi:MAG: hypothetical protein JST49_02970 [Bacteroidetes bacterium]|nr:hypothetical protein [Bacteroidota bacterium]
MALLFAGCAKEKTPSECDTLYDVYKPTGFTNGQSYTVMDSTQFVYGSINPNDPNEVVYYGGKHPNWHMYVYNVSTKQRTKVSDHSPTHNIKWHRSGWICYATTDNNIYIVKPNGDSLRQLTVTGDCFTPEWNALGDKIICYRGYQGFTDGNNYIINKFTGIVSPINLTIGGVGTCSWSPNDSIIISAPWTDVRCINYYTGEEKNVPNMKSPKTDISGVCWMPDGKRILWCPESQPEILNFETGHSQALLSACDKMEYTYPSVTADGRYALFNLNIGGYVGYNTTQTKRRLSRIDLTTNTETILELPE